MSKASDHIQPGTKCIKCKTRPATVLTRLVARDSGMAADALLKSSDGA